VARFAINKSFYATNVSFPGSVGTSVGVGNLNTKLQFLVADLAFCHWSCTSFKIGVIPFLNQLDNNNRNKFKLQAFFSFLSAFFEKIFKLFAFCAVKSDCFGQTAVQILIPYAVHRVIEEGKILVFAALVDDFFHRFAVGEGFELLHQAKIL
jgi:hypothetical protein